MFKYGYHFCIILFIGLLIFNSNGCLAADVGKTNTTSAANSNNSQIPFYPKINYNFKHRVFGNKSYRVLEVLDGDTVLIRENKEDIYVRLINIDCDETKPIYRAYKQAYETKRTIEDVIKNGIAAKDYLLDLVNENPTGYVDIEFFGLDKYGRKLGVLYKNNKNLNNEMLKSGFCAVFEYNTVNE